MLCYAYDLLWTTHQKHNKVLSLYRLRAERDDELSVWLSVEMTDVKLDFRKLIVRTIGPTFGRDDQE